MRGDLVLGREEVYKASSRVWSFHKVDDIVEGINIKLSNMVGGFPFKFAGIEWRDSERLYLCGEFSSNTDEHNRIQSAIMSSKSGYAAKRFVKTPNKKSVRDDFSEFRLQWMLFCVWVKCLGNPDFRRLLLSIPNNVILVENTTTDNEGSAEIWGCKNRELMQERKKLGLRLREEHKDLKKKDLELFINIAINKLNNVGEWRGQNNIGKILMICKRCLENGIEPSIDYNLLSDAKIHLFGKVLQCFDLRNPRINHPQGQIELLGSKLLDCTPKCTVLPEPENREERYTQTKLFADNIGLFITHREAILSDSRMFLAPIAISNGLAYSGAFQPATLGVYLEWWQSCEGAVRTNDKGEKAYICRLSGSPLSGCNACLQVYLDGRTEGVQVNNFRHLWRTFLEINTRYKEAKRDYEAYSLQQVIDILKLKNNEEDIVDKKS